jgi:hypothetical protein
MAGTSRAMGEGAALSDAVSVKDVVREDLTKSV